MILHPCAAAEDGQPPLQALVFETHTIGAAGGGGGGAEGAGAQP